MSTLSTKCVICSSPALKRCPVCKDMGISTYFCTQECFKKNWTAHSATHATTTLFANCDEGQEGADEYKTFDDDKCIGKQIPSLETCDVLQGSLGGGDVRVYVVWGQYHKPGYKFLPMYTRLQAKYGKKVNVVGVSVDPDKGYPTKFIEDPGKKYSTVFPCKFTQVWDNGAVVKKALLEVLESQTLSPPHAFVMDKNNKVVWHQDHSELGATAPCYMELMEQQIDAALAGKALTKAGNRPERVYDEPEVEEECEVAIDGDDDDPFAFM